jgi:hypothetical protein
MTLAPVQGTVSDPAAPSVPAPRLRSNRQTDAVKQSDDKNDKNDGQTARPPAPPTPAVPTALTVSTSPTPDAIPVSSGYAERVENPLIRMLWQ